VIETYQRQFEAFAANGGREGPAWLPELRRSAMDQFVRAGFPTSRDEEWRFTPVSPIVQAEFPPAVTGSVDRAALTPYRFGHAEWPQLVFVNGRFAPEHSSVPELPAGVRIESLAAALASGTTAIEPHLSRYARPETTAFTALNTALMRDGAFVHVPAGTLLEQPVHVLFVTTPGASGAAHPRNLIVVERGARASVVESYVGLKGTAAYFTNAVTEVFSGEDAWTEHTRLQREGEHAFHIGLTQVAQARGSHYRSFTLAMGGAISRHNLHVQLNAPGIETLMYGLYLARGEQLVDNHTAIFHDHPNCNSWEVYKGVLEDRSRAVFNGKVFVKPEAQKTDAKQTNRNLLLSPDAKVDTKPQLEIFADDVRCTHGATVGFLDPGAQFYLQSRGMPADAARRLLTYAFAAEVVNEVALEPVRQELDRLVLDRLGRG
jgi:Fe-S cluster assembly protein SufD